MDIQIGHSAVPNNNGCLGGSSISKTFSTTPHFKFITTMLFDRLTIRRWHGDAEAGNSHTNACRDGVLKFGKSVEAWGGHSPQDFPAQHPLSSFPRPDRPRKFWASGGNYRLSVDQPVSPSCPRTSCHSRLLSLGFSQGQGLCRGDKSGFGHNFPFGGPTPRERAVGPTGYSGGGAHPPAPPERGCDGSRIREMGDDWRNWRRRGGCEGAGRGTQDCVAQGRGQGWSGQVHANQPGAEQVRGLIQTIRPGQVRME
jgi:hypothetical protein